MRLNCRRAAVCPLPAVVALTVAVLAGWGASSGQDTRTRDIELYQRRAVEYLELFRREDLAQALRLFGQVAKLAPEDPRGHAGLAEVRALRFLWGWDPDPEALQKGVRSAQKAVEAAPESAQARFSLGIARMAENRYTPALQELDRAVSLAPHSLRAHLYRGMLLRGLRRTGEARAAAVAALKASPASPAAHALLGDCLQDERLYLESRNSYLTAAELDQRFLWARLGLAAAYQRQTNYPAAEKTYLLTEGEFPDDTTRIRILAASLLVAGQRYEDAVTVYQGIAENEAISPPLMRRLMQAGRAYSLEKLGKPEEAEFFWNRLVEEFPADFDGGTRDREVAAQAYEALAGIYDAKGEGRRAQTLLEKACRHQGMPFGIYAALSERQISQGKPADAVETLRRGLRGVPPDEDWVVASQDVLHAIRAVSARNASKEARSKAHDLLEEVSVKVSLTDPASHVPYLNLAKGEALLGMSPQALDHLRRAAQKGFGGLGRLATDPDFREIAGEPGFKQLTESP